MEWRPETSVSRAALNLDPRSDDNNLVLSVATDRGLRGKALLQFVIFDAQFDAADDLVFAFTFQQSGYFVAMYA